MAMFLFRTCSCQTYSMYNIQFTRLQLKCQQCSVKQSLIKSISLPLDNINKTKEAQLLTLSVLHVFLTYKTEKHNAQNTTIFANLMGKIH